MNFLKKLFQKNDWVIVESYTGTWTLGGKPALYCYYNIELSPSQCKYRISFEGEDPKNHSLYGEVLKRLAQLNKEILNDPAKIRDEKLKQLGI